MKSRRPFTRTLRLLAGLLLLATLGTWVATGAHTGWTRTKTTEMRTDEITGIEFPVERDAFVAGVDSLAAGAGLVVLLAGASLVTARFEI